jgi:MoaA/NifB/PqqE/SkfB family radical SAM enzyme
MMCDIWKSSRLRSNGKQNEVEPEFYRRLPPSLREINITGGEPFLRKDLAQIIKVIAETCPKARIVISTNGFLTAQIKKIMPQILLTNPKIAVRISLDGIGGVHDKVRGIKNGYQKAMTSLNYLKAKVSDLGIGFTLMERNKEELLKVWNFCQKSDIEFSLSLVSASPIYFGKNKINLRPKKTKQIAEIFQKLIAKQHQSSQPKSWFRAWFNQGLYDFFMAGRRPLSCLAGQDFFYLDAYGKVFSCHLQPWLLGDLTTHTFNELYNNNGAEDIRKKAGQCNGCWMSCSVRSRMKQEWLRVGKEVLLNKIRSNWFSCHPERK